MVQLYGALAADRLLFNSAFNRESFFNGIGELLQKLPDQTPHNLLPRLESKSAILPVPIRKLTGSNAHRNPQLILWNHRWEYDKNPQLFADALLQLKQKNQPFQLALLGERPGKKNAALLQIEQQLASHIVFNGKANRQEYQHYLQQAAIVVSTAIHEFQGLAILEAVSAGAVPLVPDALCYREQYSPMFRYPPQDSQALADKLLRMLQQTPAAPDVSAWYEENLVDSWAQYLTPVDSTKLI
jgi:glycosyltransferase involved in cell wall biosynthesis